MEKKKLLSRIDNVLIFMKGYIMSFCPVRKINESSCINFDEQEDKNILISYFIWKIIFIISHPKCKNNCRFSLQASCPMELKIFLKYFII